MKEHKLEKEYRKEFGNVPRDPIDRIDYLIHNMNLHRSRKRIFEELKRINNIKWKEISFTVFILPKPTPRPRLGVQGCFYVKGANDNKQFFKRYVENKDIPLITTPTEIECRSYLPIPKSMHSVDKILAELGFIYPTSKPDVDNLVKAYCDMIQGLILYDDALVVKMVSEKFYSVKPRIEIIIRYMESHDCDFNKKKIMKG